MIQDQKLWDSWVEKNTDPYGGACVSVARGVMELLDKEDGDIDSHDIICRADKNVKAGGITGAMAGAVASMVSQCHSRGEEFRKQWNGDHGVKPENDKGGVVNPAVITINVKDDE